MVILDSCVLINLLATGRFPEIAASFPSKATICPAVKSEALFLRNPGNTSVPKSPISLDIFLSSGALAETVLESLEEKQLFVDLTSELDDGEAMALAISISRREFVATDERKAAKLYLELGGEEAKLRTSLDLLKAWSEAGSLSPTELQTAMSLIRMRANYRPHTAHPLFKWWVGVVGTS